MNTISNDSLIMVLIDIFLKFDLKIYIYIYKIIINCNGSNDRCNDKGCCVIPYNMMAKWK